MIDYTQTEQFDSYLNRVDSILAQPSVMGRLDFLGGIEETLTEMLEGGVFGGFSQTQGIEFNIDKASQQSYIQSRNYTDGTTGWRIDSDGDINIKKSGALSVYHSDGTLAGKITTDNTTAGVVIKGGNSGKGVMVYKTGASTADLVPFGGSFGCGNSTYPWGEVYTSQLNLNQNYVAGDPTTTGYFLIKLKGTFYRVPIQLN